MKTGLIKKPKEFSSFTAVPNSILRDVNLTSGAVGIYCFLFSHTQEFSVSIEFIAGAFKDGKSSVKAKIKELEEAGYLERERVKGDNGLFIGYNYILKLERAVENRTAQSTCSSIYVQSEIQPHENRTQSNINNNIINNNTKKKEILPSSQKSATYTKIVTDAFPHFRELFKDALAPKTKAQETTWLNALAFLEKHKYNLREVYAAVKWARQDPFWGPNVLALPPLTKAKNSVRKIDNILAKFRAIKKEQSRPESMNKIKGAEWVVRPNALGEMELYAISKGEVINEFILNQSLGISKNEIQSIKEFLK